jgi:cell division protein FtsZ
MTINLMKPDLTELKPRITVFGVGGGGGNAVNNMINAGLEGVEFVVANTDAQALAMSRAGRIIQLGAAVTEGLGAGSQPDVGRAAAEECIDEILDHLNGVHMCFVTAGMGGGTGTGAAPVVARAARERGILTVGVVTKPFHFEGRRRMLTADKGIEALQEHVDTLIVIPNQNLFRIANDKTTFADAFAMADQVLYSGVACITDLMVKEGLINLDFADVRSVMRNMGKAMMGTGEASGDGRAMAAAEAAISNPLLDETSMNGAQGLLISITGGRDMTLFEVDEAATRIREEVDPEANIIVGATFDESLEGVIRVSVVATGIDGSARQQAGDFRVALKPAVAAQPRIAAAPRPQPAAIPQPAQQAATMHMAAPAARMESPAPAAHFNAVHAQPAHFQQAPQQQAPIPQASIPQAPAMQAVAKDPIADVINREASRADDWENDIATRRQSPAGDAFKPRSSLFAGAAAPAAAPQQAMRAPQPVQPVMAPVAAAPIAPLAPRMPQIEEFPAPVQAAYGERGNARPATEDRTAVGLLRRLTSGLTRRDDEASTLQPAMPREPSLRPAQIEPRRVEPAASIYAPRRDETARPVAAANSADDDMMEIPAFLRRHAGS